VKGKAVVGFDDRETPPAGANGRSADRRARTGRRLYGNQRLKNIQGRTAGFHPAQEAKQPDATVIAAGQVQKRT
jgi:hypothetical protein